MLDLLDQVEQNLAVSKIGIQEFAESSDFCDKPLYPRQRVLLKTIFLEELTGYEEDILDYWIAGGRNGSEVVISPDIRERVQYLRDAGYEHFREIDLVGGRRSSKGFMTGMALGKVMWDTLQLQDPGRYYGIDPDKDIFFSCVAGSEAQAKEFQYADFSSTIESCKAFEPYLAKSLETEFRVSTPEDLRRLRARKSKGIKLDKDIAKLRGKALAANAGTLRGSATMAIAIDEMAWMITGESKASADQVYSAANPSLDQFGKAAIIFCNPPEAPIWMADLSHKPIGEIKIGDKVVGWNKELPKDCVSRGRVLQESIVTNVMRRQSPIVKVTMESGRSFRCTPDHKWLTLSSGGSKKNGEWYAEPKVGRKLAHVIDPTPQLPEDLKRDAAWLGGLFDGEGYAARAKALTICQSKNVNPKICENIERVLNSLGFDWTYHQINSKLGEGGAYHIKAYQDERRSKQAAVDFANWTTPVQLHKLQDKVFTSGWRNEDRIKSIEEDGEGEVIALTTSTGNYICNGYASKNCNSSPYSKVGMFYERVQASMVPFDPNYSPGEQITQNRQNGSPLSMTFQFPSWALFEGYQDDPNRRFRKAITVSPDWDPEEKNEDGSDKWSAEDQAQITIARAEEAANPENYKVERRGKFAEVTAAYLNPEMVDIIYMGVPESSEIDPDTQKEIRKYTQLNTNWGQGATNLFKYKAHLDPSSTTAGFGFALGHIEMFKNHRDEMEEHVVFDIVKRWNPKDFPGETIKWDTVINEVIGYCDLFRPYEVTFDQFQSAEPVQTLKYALHERGIEGVNVYVNTATLEKNWYRAETFKTAINHHRVHAPNDTEDAELSCNELKFLQVKNTGGRYPRVDKQDFGPVTTKDIADCMMEVVQGLIGNIIAGHMRDRAAQAVMAGGAPGGFRIGGNETPSLDSLHPNLAGYYGNQKRTGEQAVPYNTNPLNSGGRLGGGRRSIARRGRR